MSAFDVTTKEQAFAHFRSHAAYISYSHLKEMTIRPLPSDHQITQTVQALIILNHRCYQLDKGTIIISNAEQLAILLKDNQVNFDGAHRVNGAAQKSA